MKINLIIFLSKFGVGGAGNSIFRLCKGLARKKYNIPVKIIYDNSSKQSLSKNIPLFEVKFLPKEYASPASTNIYGDKVAILLWEEEPLAIVIKNKKIADAYRSFFSLLWKTAKS